MLGLAQALGADPRTVFLSFAEGGRCRAFLDRVESEGFEAVALEHDTPHFRAAIRELTTRLRQLRADVLSLVRERDAAGARLRIDVSMVVDASTEAAHET